MFRRCVIGSTFPLRGRPFKKRGMPVAIHAADRPSEPSDIDFTALNLTYALTKFPTAVVKLTHWTEPPTSRPEELPFFVERTAIGKSLPVYTDLKGGKTKVVTILRRCRGDIAALVADMEKVCDGKEIIQRPGKLVVDGNYHMRLKKWLSGLGF